MWCFWLKAGIKIFSTFNDIYPYLKGVFCEDNHIVTSVAMVMDWSIKIGWWAKNENGS